MKMQTGGCIAAALPQFSQAVLAGWSLSQEQSSFFNPWCVCSVFNCFLWFGMEFWWACGTDPKWLWMTAVLLKLTSLSCGWVEESLQKSFEADFFSPLP